MDPAADRHRERHIVEPGVATSDLAAEAARQAIARPDSSRPTSTSSSSGPRRRTCSEHGVPRAAQDWCDARVGIRPVRGVSGFTYALTTAAQMVSNGSSRHALVIGADVMSSIIDYTDRTTCVIFGDGAGAAVVEASGDPDIGIIDFENYVDGSGGESLCMPARQPATCVTGDRRAASALRQAGRPGGVQVRGSQHRRACRRILQRNNLSAEKIDLLVSHPGEPADHPVGSGEAGCA